MQTIWLLRLHTPSPKAIQCPLGLMLNNLAQAVMRLRLTTPLVKSSHLRVKSSHLRVKSSHPRVKHCMASHPKVQNYSMALLIM